MDKEIVGVGLAVVTASTGWATGKRPKWLRQFSIAILIFGCLTIIFGFISKKEPNLAPNTMVIAAGGTGMNAAGAQQPIMAGRDVNLARTEDTKEQLQVELVARQFDNGGRSYDQLSLDLTNLAPGVGVIHIKHMSLMCDGREYGAWDHHVDGEWAVAAGADFSAPDMRFGHPQNLRETINWAVCKGKVSLKVTTTRNNNFWGQLRR